MFVPDTSFELLYTIKKKEKGKQTIYRHSNVIPTKEN